MTRGEFKDGEKGLTTHDSLLKTAPERETTRRHHALRVAVSCWDWLEAVHYSGPGDKLPTTSEFCEVLEQTALSLSHLTVAVTMIRTHRTGPPPFPV